MILRGSRPEGEVKRDAEQRALLFMDDLEGIEANGDARGIESGEDRSDIDTRVSAPKRTATGQWKRMVQPKDCLLITKIRSSERR